MDARSKAGESHAPLPCWFCEERIRVADVLRDGILRGRREQLGGPYRLYICPHCNRENLCEKTPGGRWFASPNFRLTFMDFIFSRLLSPDAEDFLAAVSWFRDKEASRRAYFERDGDGRYSGKSVLLRLWPSARVGESDAAATERRRRRRPHADSGRDEAPRAGGARDREERGSSGPDARRDAPEGDDRRRRKERREDRPPRTLVTPHEILGVAEDADERDIDRAFHRLAIHYHPDKVYHRGEEFRRLAHEKFKELQAAYESLRQRRDRG